MENIKNYIEQRCCMLPVFTSLGFIHNGLSLKFWVLTKNIVDPCIGTSEVYTRMTGKSYSRVQYEFFNTAILVLYSRY
jgi:hypothetical protein